MLLLILAVIWAGVVVSLVRDRVSERPGDSIGSFRNQLNVLQRTAPTTVVPANTLRSPGSSLGPARIAAAPKASRSSAQARTIERRRQVFLALLASMAATLVIGFVPALRAAWALHIVLDLLFAGYVALLVSLRNRQAEREMKLRFLPSAQQSPEPALLLRRSAN